MNYGYSIQNSASTSTIPVITPLDKCSPPIVFHPSDDRQILMFNLWSGKEIGPTLRAHFGPVRCLALGKDEVSNQLFGFSSFVNLK